MMNITVDFFVPGFSKCGTTTLFEVLNMHPDIYIPPCKEPNYFGFPKDAHREEWYQGLFVDAENSQLKGDCSTFYSSISAEQACIDEIHQNNPNAKFIFLARDPVKRIESSFREMHNSAPKYGLNTPYSLGDAFEAMPQIIEDSAFYSRLKAYQDRVGEENTLVLLIEDIKNDLNKAANRCYNFLGLTSLTLSEQDLPHENAGETKLYDSRVYRWLRRNAVTGNLLSKVSIKKQDDYAKRIGLRRPFTHAVSWDKKADDIFQRQLVPDIEKFITQHAIDRQLWPQYQKKTHTQAQR